jgi:hypothetical protein
VEAFNGHLAHVCSICVWSGTLVNVSQAVKDYSMSCAGPGDAVQQNEDFL